jgi:HPt (histidine-containing phosphotransfer) domain-containing protein
MEAVDRAVLERLADELGDYEAVVDIVRGYLDLLPSRLEELEIAPAVDPDDPDAIRPRRLAAHTLKSGALLLGANELANAAEQVEYGDGSPDDVRREARSAARDWRRWLASALARHPRNS